MRQATADPRKSSWEYLHGRLFNYDATPLGPLGIPVIIHNKPRWRKYRDYRGRNGFSASVALNHYRFQRAIDTKTKVVSIMDTIEFCHNYLTQTSIKPEDCLIHALQTLTASMHDKPYIHSAQHLQEIDHLRHIFQAWQETNTNPSPNPHAIPKVTRPDVTRPPQDTTIDKPCRTHWHKKSPRVTPT